MKGFLRFLDWAVFYLSVCGLGGFGWNLISHGFYPPPIFWSLVISGGVFTVGSALAFIYFVGERGWGLGVRGIARAVGLFLPGSLAAALFINFYVAGAVVVIPLI